MAIYYYYAPKVKNVSVIRCDSSGKENDSGTCMKISATRDFCPFYQTSVGADDLVSNKCEIRYRYKMIPSGSYSAWVTILASSVTNTDTVTDVVLSVGLNPKESYEVIVGVKDDVSEANTCFVLTAGGVFMHRDGEKRSIGIGEAVTEEKTVSIAADMALKVRGQLSVGGEMALGSAKLSSTSVDMHEDGIPGNFYMSLPANAELPAYAYLAHPNGGYLRAECGAGRALLTGLTAPVDASDAVNKEYVDSLTASDVGARPETYTYASQNGGDCNSYVNETHLFVFNMSNRPSAFNYGWFDVWRASGTGFSPNGAKPIIVQRFCNWKNNSRAWRFSIDGGATWDEWAYDNPFCNIGTEYLTTKWYNSKPVYTKLVNVGTLPNNSTIEVSHGVTATQFTAVRCVAFRSNGEAFEIPFANAGTQCQLTSTGTIKVKTDWNAAAYSAHVTLEYTKD